MSMTHEWESSIRQRIYQLFSSRFWSQSSPFLSPSVSFSIESTGGRDGTVQEACLTIHRYDEIMEEILDWTPGDWLPCPKRYRKRSYSRRFQSNTLRKIQYSKVKTWSVLRRVEDTVPSTKTYVIVS